MYYDNEVITGCPLLVKVHPDISKILYSGIDPCALGSVVEVLVRITFHNYIVTVIEICHENCCLEIMM